MYIYIYSLESVVGTIHFLTNTFFPDNIASTMVSISTYLVLCILVIWSYTVRVRKYRSPKSKKSSVHILLPENNSHLCIHRYLIRKNVAYALRLTGNYQKYFQLIVIRLRLTILHSRSCPTYIIDDSTKNDSMSV